MEVVWLSDRSPEDKLSFVMVLQGGTPHNVPGAKPQQVLLAIWVSTLLPGIRWRL